MVLLRRFKILLGEWISGIDFENFITKYWNHCQNCQINMELWKSLSVCHDGFGIIEMGNFVLLLFLTQLWRHCYFIKVSILYILGLLPTPPSLWHPFWMIPYRKIIENYRNISLLNWYGYCAIDMKILETKLLLQNWFGNIEFHIDIAEFILQYWNHFCYCWNNLELLKSLWYCNIYLEILISILILQKTVDNIEVGFDILDSKW